MAKFSCRRIPAPTQNSTLKTQHSGLSGLGLCCKEGMCHQLLCCNPESYLRRQRRTNPRRQSRHPLSKGNINNLTEENLLIHNLSLIIHHFSLFFAGIIWLN
jgi:hypothetical protein